MNNSLPALFLLIFTSVFIAQMGDKTQLLTLILAHKIKRHGLLFAGIMVAYFITVGLVVIFGSQVGMFIPQNILKILSALLFMGLGLLLFIKSDKFVKKYKNIHPRHQFFSTIMLISFADFGDKTQIALGLFSASYHPVLVFLAGISALGLATILTIIFAKVISRKVKESVIEKLAGGLFIIIGLFLLFR